MENIILIGHGSPKHDANNLEIIGSLLHNAIHDNCSSHCVKVAYLQFAEPGIPAAIEHCVSEGARRVIIHPFFLTSGLHVTRDIPEMIETARSTHPSVEFVYTEPLGVHEKLVQVILERIRFTEGYAPEDIERRSLDAISGEADFSGFPEEQLAVVKRVIHATADFDFMKTLLFHPAAVKTGLDAITAGKNILTDVEMVRAGITKKRLEQWGGKVICRISDEDVIRLSRETGRTRSGIAIEKGLDEQTGIIAIGNAPTALLRVLEMLNSPAGPCPPPLIIGVPVGFVNALESKALLSTQRFPFITNLSRKGGTPVAVAIVNALLRMAARDDG
jgi:precorrin-8X/cobalt-precorrin-8 methylmutase